MATWNELAMRIFGTDSKEEASHLLWGATAFPFASPLHIARQLKDLKKRSGGNFDIAMAIADTEARKELDEINKRNALNPKPNS